jgi:hypothetical protein
MNTDVRLETAAAESRDLAGDYCAGTGIYGVVRRPPRMQPAKP